MDVNLDKGPCFNATTTATVMNALLLGISRTERVDFFTCLCFQLYADRYSSANQNFEYG